MFILKLFGHRVFLSLAKKKILWQTKFLFEKTLFCWPIQRLSLAYSYFCLPYTFLFGVEFVLFGVRFSVWHRAFCLAYSLFCLAYGFLFGI